MFGKQNRAWVRSWQTIRLFFASEARWPAISWFALLLVVLLTASGLNVVNSYVGRDFMTAISAKDWNHFVTYGFFYLLVFALSTIMATFSRFSEERLRLLWRGWLTRLLIDLYMSRDRFYRLKALEEVDNPDERITEDVKSYTQTTLSFFLLTLNAAITSLAFLGVLWSITPWLVLVALIYAAAGSAMTVLLGRPLVRLDNLQLQKEADLRYHLIQTRETAEAIATMGAARTARECLRARLAAVVANNKRIIAVTRNLGLFTNGYNYMTQLIPLVIVAPLYMQGHVEFGVVTQASMAFATFLSGFSLIITQFETLSSFAAVTDRLDTIAQALEQSRTPISTAIRIDHADDRVAFEGLSLWSRHERRPLIEGLMLEVPTGGSLLITGPDTAAEEALFLATAGFWDQGKGRIVRPNAEGISFVPTQALTLRSTLRAQLGAGVLDGRPVSNEEIQGLLDELGLTGAVARVGGLDTEIHAPTVLSPAEQRLILFTRLLLARPRFAFLDRVGSVLNQEQIEVVYRLLKRSSIGYLSIGDAHRLGSLHDQALEIRGEGRWRLMTGAEAGGDVEGDGLDGRPVTNASGSGT